MRRDPDSQFIYQDQILWLTLSEGKHVHCTLQLGAVHHRQEESAPHVRINLQHKLLFIPQACSKGSGLARPFCFLPVQAHLYMHMQGHT